MAGIRIRLCRVLLLPAFDGVERLRMGHIERPQNQRVHQAKGDRVCPNAECQGQDGNCGEAGRLAQDAESETKILSERFDESAAGCVVALLPESLIAAELDAGAALGRKAGNAGAFQVVRAVLDVRAQFLFQLGVGMGTLEESGDAETDRTEDAHTSSGCVESAAPIAATSRFQLSVSSRKRLRPVAVSA